MNSYELAIQKTIHQLSESKENLVDNIFQIAINGELKVWSEITEVGEHYFFSKELLQSLEDEKVQMLISLVEQMEFFINNYFTD
ncbi:MAG: hypothetical protein EOO44_18565 [Flavobacterium sp.]|nr:MAG: hypothetical protein EOO44_18565 [Flavobacterium sp.]